MNSNLWYFVLFMIMLSCQTQQTNVSTLETNESILPTDQVDGSFLNQFTTGKNYLDVKIEDVDSEADRVTVSVSWDGSWRNGDLYDAAWIFLKVRDSESSWAHLPVISAKQIDDGSPSAQIDISNDNVGMFVYHAKNGEGDNQWTIDITINQLRKPGASKLRAYGLEMVHIAEGPFEIGTLKAERDRREELTPGASGAPYNPFFTYREGMKNNYGGVYNVTSEGPIQIGPKDGQLFWQDANIPGTNTFSGVPEGRLEIDFPKGTAAFYQMKYELSQQEYCDFLNALSSKQQQSRDFTAQMEYKRPIADYRNAIKFDGKQFVTNRPQRPCNFISWLDGQAFADWAGLRHMTELEFEKACRGPEVARYREYVWGVNEIKVRDNLRFSTGFFDADQSLAQEENGMEQTDGNIHASMFSYFNIQDVCVPGSRFYDPDCAGCRGFSGGDGGRGPVRKGIFGQTSNGDRVKAGSTYYGAMEMGGNLQEPVVTVGHPSGRKFRGTHGDGMLTVDGFADNPDWQPIEGDYAFGGRGGCWKFHENHARTSDRFKGLRTKQNRRASHIGFRGVRTADITSIE